MKKQYQLLVSTIVGFVSFIALLSIPLTNLKAQIHINEIMTGNTTLEYMDPTWNFGGWVEFYNAGDASVNLYGYYLSDEPDNPKKYRISSMSKTVKPKGYAVLWFDNNDISSDQVNFKLSHDGGELALYNISGILVDQIEYPQQVLNVSFARMEDGSENWGYCITPTFGTSNTGSTFAFDRCPAPTFNITGGLYKNAQTVTLSCPPGMEIRYTLNCEEPDDNSNIWPSGSSQTFHSTTILRAQVRAPGSMPGPLMTQSYIIENRDFTLPVTSIVTVPKYLTDNTIGIYVRGTNGIPGNGEYSPCNWNQNWSRPSNFEYLQGNEQLFSQACDIAIGGGWTRAYNSVKGLKLRAEKKYDNKNKFDYPFFSAKPNLKFKGLYLRSSGNDFGETMMRDAFQQVLIEGVLDVEYQAYQPTIHYLNGKYCGIINLRERNNQQYVYSNFGYDKDSIDLMEKIAPSEGNYSVLNGTDVAMKELINKTQNAASKSVYEEIQQLMDIDEYIAYLVVEMYSGGTDWPTNNTKYFRHQNNGKFRWTLYDLDFGFSNTHMDPFSRMNYNECNNIHTVEIYRNLIKNETFKQRFIDYFTLIMGSVYQPSRVAHIVDSLAANIRTEAARSNSNVNWNSFNSRIAGFKSFPSSRNIALISYMKNNFSLGDAVSLDISSNLPHATLHMNDIPVPLGASSGYTFKGKDLTVKAITPAGYEFEGWHVLDESGGKTVSSFGSIWSYYDQGSLDGTGWYQTSYDASSWKRGKAPLGYGNHEIITTLDYGPSVENKRPTAYLRNNFTIDDLNIADKFTLNLNIDDGAVVYINGQEVVRHLMPSGTISYSTWASTHAPGNPDRVVYNLPATAFKQGNNVIAVEVHQHEGKSSDIYLDVHIVQKSVNSGTIYKEPEVTFRVEGPLNLQALFTKKQEDPNKPLAPVRINEISASNDIYVNEYFKSEDWIELYNTTDQPVSIAGLYISREKEDPKQYQIPDTPESETIIPPFGYRILWADKQEDRNQLHLPFKLAGEGGTITLTKMTKDGMGNETVQWSDQLTYVRHSSDHTFGRYPDGSDSLFIMHRTSFAAPNLFSFLSESVQNENLTGIKEITTGSGLEENGITLFYNRASMELTVDMQEASAHEQRLLIYNLPGQIMGQYTIPSGQTSYTLQLGDLPSGYHIAVLQTPSGQKVTFRFIR